jgi:hypothetical protein
MLDWHVQTYRKGEPQERPTTFSSAQDAIKAANSALRASAGDEMVVFHRLYSDQAFLRFSAVIKESEVLPQASHLEQQARRAAKMG